MERPLIEEATAVIEAFEGKRPAGWLGPWISESRVTPDLLAERGYAYLLDWCMDDQPVWLSTRNGGRILAVPYPQEVNDIPSIVARKDSAEQFADIIVDNFDEMLEQAIDAPLVMGIALHPYLVGQPYRLRHLRRALRHVAGHRERISMTTAGAIASHVTALDHRE
jgi:allantoinase